MRPWTTAGSGRAPSRPRAAKQENVESGLTPGDERNASSPSNVVLRPSGIWIVATALPPSSVPEKSKGPHGDWSLPVKAGPFQVSSEIREGWSWLFQMT